MFNILLLLLSLQISISASDCISYQTHLISSIYNTLYDNPSQTLQVSPELIYQKSILQTDLIEILSKTLESVKQYKYLTNYDPAEQIDILTMLYRIKDLGVVLQIEHDLTNNRYQQKLVRFYLTKYRELFLKNLEKAKTQKHFENLISEKQGNKFNPVESVVYMKLLYDIIKKALLTEVSLAHFVENVGLELNALMKDNPFIGINTQKRYNAGIKRDTSVSLYIVNNSHLKPYTSQFISHINSGKYIFKGYFYRIKNALSLLSVKYNEEVFYFNPMFPENISQIRDTKFDILKQEARILTRSLLGIDLDKICQQGNTVPFDLSIDTDYINGTETRGIAIFNFYYDNTNNVIFSYPDIGAVDLMQKLLNNDYLQLVELYKKKELSVSDYKRLFTLNTRLSYYLSRYVPYRRGSSGVARILFTIIMEKLNGELPNLKAELLDLDAFTMDEDTYLEKYKNNFYKASTLSKRQGSR